MSGIEWRVVYFRKLLFENNNETFSLKRVNCMKISGHPWGNLLQSGLEVGDSSVKVTRMEWEKSWVSYAWRWWFRESEKMRVLSGIVYMTKSRGQRTEPRGTPQEEICSEEKSLSHLTRKKRDVNQLKTEAWIPIEDKRRVIRTLWSMVSKAADRSGRQGHDNFCDPMALMRWSWIELFD